MKPKTSYSNLLIITFAFILFISGTYYLGKQSPVTTTTIAPTVNWKTYTNTQWKFSLKHPENWTAISFQKPMVDLLPPDFYQLTDGSISVSLEMNNDVPRIPSSWTNPVVIESTNFDNATWARLNNQTGEITFWKDSIQVYGQIIRSENVTQKMLIDILSSFKFLSNDSDSSMLVKIYQSPTDVTLSCESVDYTEVNLPKSVTPLTDSINYLISQFKDSKGFKLISATISNGIATLTFDDPNFFTSGGSCKSMELSSQIEKTALQFPTVKKVKFIGPEYLFQP